MRGTEEHQFEVIHEKLLVPFNSLLEKWEELITRFYAVPPIKEKFAAIIRVLGDNKLSLNTVWLLMKPTTWTQPTVYTGRHVPMVMSSASASVEVQRKRVGGAAIGCGSHRF